MKRAALKGLVVANFILGFSLQGLAQEPDIGKLDSLITSIAYKKSNLTPFS